ARGAPGPVFLRAGRPPRAARRGEGGVGADARPGGAASVSRDRRPDRPTKPSSAGGVAGRTPPRSATACLGASDPYWVRGGKVTVHPAGQIRSGWLGSACQTATSSRHAGPSVISGQGEE